MDTISRLATLAAVGASIVTLGSAPIAKGQSFAGGAIAGQTGVAIGAGRSGPAPARAASVGPSIVRAPSSVGAVHAAPLRPSPAWRGPTNIAHQGFLQQTPAAGRNGIVSRPPTTIGVPHTGFTARQTFDNHYLSDGHRRRSYPRREIRPYYNPSYYGAGLGGYGYPYLYVQTYGYPFSALPLGPAESSTVYAGPAVDDVAASPEASPSEEPDSLVQDVQSELIRRGYLAGKATGIVTKDFQAALRRFQADKHLASSGLINEASLFALGLN